MHLNLPFKKITWTFMLPLPKSPCMLSAPLWLLKPLLMPLPLWLVTPGVLLVKLIRRPVLPLVVMCAQATKKMIRLFNLTICSSQQVIAGSYRLIGGRQ